LLGTGYQNQLLITNPFLVGPLLATVPDPRLSHIPVGGRWHWQSMQALLQGLWNKWHHQYLTALQQSPKLTISAPNLSIGDFDLVK